MSMDTIQTWGAWDVRCLNAVMKVPELVEVRLAVFDSRTCVYLDELRWESVEKFGPHSLDGSYSDITLRAGKASFRLEFAAEGDSFTYKVTPLQHTPTLRFYVAGLLRWNAPGSVARNRDELRLSAQGNSYIITVTGNLDHQPVNATHQGLLVDGRETFYVRCNQSLSPTEMDAFLEAKRAGWMAQSLSGGGILGGAPEAMIKGVLWNTIYEPIKKRFCTPVTREWCIIKPERPWFGSYVLFAWDTSFAALLSGAQDESLAYQQIYSLLQEMTGDNIPCTSSEVNTWAERSQLPITTYCVLKLYHQFHDVAFLERTFDKLLRHHQWWLKHRDGNQDGLLEWGTDLPVPPDANLPGYLSEARAESGLDNSPMYDDTRFNPQTHTMELIDVGLSCVYALDALCLAEIATILGKAELAQSLNDEYEKTKALIQRELWNEELGIYCNKHWDGHFSTALSPTCFYPMLAGIATPEQAECMVRSHLLNEDEFWGDYVIPSIARNHPAFHDNDYWRGRIWAPTNFLVAEGLKRYGFYSEAYAFARKSLNLFLKEWEEKNHIHENYNTLTGDGDDVENADPVYTWGGLLAYIALGEWIEVQPQGGLRFGNLAGEKGRIDHFPSGDGVYTVIQDAGLAVLRDGKKLFESQKPVRITGFRQVGDTLSFEATALTPGWLHLWPPTGIKFIHACVNGSCTLKEVQAQASKIEFTIQPEIN